jgi:recombinational DNA repair protein RecR
MNACDNCSIGPYSKHDPVCRICTRRKRERTSSTLDVVSEIESEKLRRREKLQKDKQKRKVD